MTLGSGRASLQSTGVIERRKGKGQEEAESEAPSVETNEQAIEDAKRKGEFQECPPQ